MYIEMEAYVSDSSALVTAATSGYSCGANSMNTAIFQHNFHFSFYF